MVSEQLKKLSFFIEKRRRIAGYYNRELKDIKFLEIPALNGTNVFYRYLLKLKGDIELEKCIQFLQTKGVEAKKPIYKPLHRYFERYDKKEFANTEKVYKETISLPIYPALTDDMAVQVVHSMKEFIREHV